MKIQELTINTLKLVTYLLNADYSEPWRMECEIIPDYMPPYPNSNTRPSCVVRLSQAGWENPIFLRYSHGPKQGFFWDIYGDDFDCVELAILAISQAPIPRCCDPITFKIPLTPK